MVVAATWAFTTAAVGASNALVVAAVAADREPPLVSAAACGRRRGEGGFRNMAL